jgi:hypothetical protein
MKQITSNNPPNAVEYSIRPFSSDGTRLLLQGSTPPNILDHFVLYDGDGNFLYDTLIAADDEPRWYHKKKPASFVYHVAGALYEWTERQPPLLLHIFTEYTAISGSGESDISVDDDHMVFLGTKEDGTVDVFVFEISTRTKVQTYPQSLPIDGVKITADNEVIISRNSDPHKPSDGIFVLDATGERRLTDLDEHACVAVYRGRTKLLWAESDTINACVMIDVKTGARTILALQLPWDYAIHIAWADGMPWCTISTDCPDHKLPAQVWTAYFDTSIASELICEPGSVFSGYVSEIKAAVWASPDGSQVKIVGCSNFGKTGDPNYSDVFMVQTSSHSQTPIPDPNVWVEAKPPVGQKWTFEGVVGGVVMNDVDPVTGALTPIKIAEGNSYLFLKINGVLKEYWHKGNK